MALFGRSKNKDSNLPEPLTPVFDDALDDEAAIEAAAAARGGEPGPARDLLAATGRDWARRQHRVATLSYRALDLGWLDRWAAEYPDDPTSVLLRGRQHIELAWEARGSGRASTVTEAGWRKFSANINIAERRLSEATEVLPDDPTPWAQLLTVAMAQSKPIDELHRIFGEAVDRDRWHHGAHDIMQNALYEKWLGDPGMALEFARSTSAAAPAGATVHALVAEAHWEEQIARKLPGKDYWLRREVRSDILAAHDRRFGGQSGPPSTWDLRDGNLFAIVFSMMWEYDRARAEFDRFGACATDYWWHMFPEREETFRAFRGLAHAVLGTTRSCRDLQERQARAQQVDRAE
jgi:hypothetical protein